MKKVRAVVPLTLVLFAAIPALVSAHEDKTDPVCGMRVDPDVVPWKAEFAGETYYFCMDADRVAFLAEPEKYAGALTLTDAREKHELVLVVRPRVPTAGEAIKLTLRGFRLGDRMASPPRPSLELGDVVAILYEMDRTRPPVPERYRVARLRGDEDVYGLARLATNPGEWRVVVDATFDGARRRGIFTIPIAPVGTASHGSHSHGPETSPPASDPHAGHRSGLSMAAQHEAMKTIGAHWYALEPWLRSGRGTQKQALEHLDAVDRAAATVSQFALHKFQDALPEFRGYAETFTQDLKRFRAALASKDRAHAERAFREIDANACTKCHLKFRWGAVEDLSRFPDLRDLPRSR